METIRNRFCIGFLLLITIPSLTSAQTTSAGQNSELNQYSYLKVSLFPGLYLPLSGSTPLWVSLQYESRFNKKKQLTYNVAVDYFSDNYRGGTSINGLRKEFAIRPQLRYYFSQEATKGYYAGVFPVYNYCGGEDAYRTGHYWGAGAITGYQFLVRKKILIELNSWILVEYGGVIHPQGAPTEQDVLWRYFMEVNIGFPIRKKR